jgi:hypothetical protein
MMNLKVIGSIAVVVLLVATFAVLSLITFIPPAHAIRTPGATSMASHLASGWVPFRGLMPAPTTSLEQMRCAAAGALPSHPCPAFASHQWSDVAQSPHMLYVALAGESVASGSSPGMNAEYDPASQALTIHTYAARPLYEWPTRADTAGIARARTLELLAIDTEGISAGEITVREDGYIERLTGDERDGEIELGTVAIG